MKLPWSEKEYTSLQPTDLDGSAPTTESRIRVAAAIATKIRDANMTRGRSLLNAETVRLVLTMDEEDWKANAPQLKSVLGDVGYDTVSGRVRFDQTRAAYPERT